MFILIISRGIPSKRYPQWGCFEKDQAEALASIGHKVVVASVDGRFRFIYRKRGLTHVVINGVDYYNHYLLPHALVNLFGRQMTLRLQNWQIDRVCDLVEKCHEKPYFDAACPDAAGAWALFLRPGGRCIQRGHGLHPLARHRPGDVRAPLAVEPWLQISQKRRVTARETRHSGVGVSHRHIH